MTLMRFRSTLAGVCMCATESEIAELTDLIPTLGKAPLPRPSVVWAILVGLYYHDRLEIIPTLLPDSSDLTLSYVIALLCLKVDPRSLIPKLCELLKSQPTLLEQLQTAKTLIDQGQSGAIARKALGKTSIAYALYCCLSTPESWEIAVQRSGELGVVVGAFVSAYRASILLQPQFSSQICQGIILGDRLFANWSGIYGIESLQLDPGITVTAI
jgi:hypothetical protein